MSTLRDWAQLLRVSALFTVPGDALAGAAAAGARPDTRTLRAVGCSLCLYQAGMALNDWADRDEDARDRPGRPLPSGRIRPAAALGAAVGLTAAGLALAAPAGRPTAAVAGALAATVWAYDLKLKHTRAAPAAMGMARGLDLLLGAVATARGGLRPAVGMSAAALTAHTYAVTHVSRNETTGGSALAPLTALATSAAIGTVLGAAGTRRRPVPMVLAATYTATAARPLLHAALNPAPPLIQRAVGGGIRSLIPLQAALAARAGAPVLGGALLALAPIARRASQKVDLT